MISYSTLPSEAEQSEGEYEVDVPDEIDIREDFEIRIGLTDVENIEEISLHSDKDGLIYEIRDVQIEDTETYVMEIERGELETIGEHTFYLYIDGDLVEETSTEVDRGVRNYLFHLMGVFGTFYNEGKLVIGIVLFSIFIAWLAVYHIKYKPEDMEGITKKSIGEGSGGEVD